MSLLFFLQIVLILLQFNDLILAQENEVSYIMRGKNVDISSAPWNVAILFNDKIHCGGSIISDTWIISAAHCFHNYRGFPLNNWKVIFGTDNLESKNITSSKIKKLVYHSQFDKPFYSNDIAVMELETPIDFNISAAQPIDFFHSSDNLALGDYYIYGFGATESSWMSTTLKEAKVKLFDEAACQKLHCKPTKTFEVLPVYKSNICAGHMTGGEDSCQGDSGGGLIYKNPKNQNFLVGIVSHGEGCGLPERPTIYTRITSFLNWISYNTKLKILRKPVPTKYTYDPKLADLFYECPWE